MEYRVYGPPGTGKTTWIARQAERAVNSFGPDQVSICSLTNAAIGEVTDRKIGVAESNISTLHARCKRALSAPSPAETRVQDFASDNPGYATEQCFPKSMLSGRTKDEEGALGEILISNYREPTFYELAAVYRQQMVPQEEWRWDVLRWYRQWEGWLQSVGIMDFTGWLEASLHHRPLPAQQVVFVDEAQDHTPLQLAVIRTWKTRIRVLVGDDDQNLYEWSGAVPGFFFKPPLPPTQEIVLSQSFRIPRQVHSRASLQIETIRNRKKKDYRHRGAEGFVSVNDSYTLADMEAEKLPDSILDQHGRSHMLLTSCGYMLSGAMTALRKVGIPFHNPYRRSNLKWNPLSSIQEKVLAYLTPIHENRTWTGTEAQSWAGTLKSTGVFQKGERAGFLEQCGEIGGGRIPGELLSASFLPKALDRLMHGDLMVFDEYRKTGAVGSWEYGLRAFDHPDFWDPKIVIGTIHSVKGGEADEVYLFPELSSAGFEDYYGPGRDRVTRLFYVGMTRTRETLHLCRPSKRTSIFW